MKHHKIDYVEFLSKDMPKTKDFYAKAFGWSFTDYGPSYAAIDGAGLDGGFDVDKPSPTPLVIVYSDNLEFSRAEVIAAGGIISTDIFAFPGGRRFHFTDPSNNELAVWSDK